MGYEFRIEGIEDLQKALGDKLSEIKEVLKKNADEAADIIKKSAKQKAPRRIGNLISSIDKNEIWDKNGKVSIFVGIQKNEVFTKADGWYARMQETGTSKMKAQPYLRPALNENKARIRKKIESDLKEVIRNDSRTGS